MKIETKRSTTQRAIASIALFCMVAQPVYALDLPSRPLFLGPAIPPQVMLTLSKDQQLFKKAYNDYSDLDGDGVPEITYKHSVRYYGYFDPVKCYSYNTTTNLYEPQSVVTDAAGNMINAVCSGQWSGNFLNWASMSRMDAVRKLLYGGYRSTDDATTTVLERAFVPPDAHAWAKFYDGTDIAKLTPFDPTIATTKVAVTTDQFQPQNVDADTKITFTTAPTFFTVGDQIKLENSLSKTSVQGPVLSMTANGAKMDVVIRQTKAGTVNPGFKVTSWNVTNLSATGISMCNLTPGSSTDRSQSNVNAPVLRVVKGNFQLWSANEVRQCQWFEDFKNAQSGFNGARSNGNIEPLSGIQASAENPARGVHGLGREGTASQGEFNVRVKACVSKALIGSENCELYPSGNFKPVGLLQQFGENNGILFGLMTGSYTKNTQGGVLRRNIGKFSDEINLATDGSFISGVKGIVTTLNNLRIYGYNYSTGNYLAAPPNGDNCTYQLTDLPNDACTSWGNPMSEIYHEAIRYFAATKSNSANASYTYTAGTTRDDVLKLPIEQWKVPLDQSKVCAKLNVLVFNASVSTNDIELGAASYLGTGPAINKLTTDLGKLEGIAGSTAYFVGQTPSSKTSDTDFQLCTAKTVSGLGDISGICPEGPTLGGSYMIAGIARQARLNPVRTDLIAPGSPDAMTVMSYGIQLATNTPQLNIAIPNSNKFVVIQPIYRLDLTKASGGLGGGALVDMKYVGQPTAAGGKVYMNWEDSEQGGDYDQDMWGTLEWAISGNTIKVTTNAVSASTANPQGFGYAISGTTADGPHFHSGIYGFNFSDPKGVMGCTDCRHPADNTGLLKPSSQTGATSVTYTIDTSKTGNTLQDPLWYLAKYGGFDDKNKDGVVDAGEWDSKINTTGVAGADQVPDNYFLVTNPLGLESSLRAALTAIATTGSAAALAANSTSLRTGSAVYFAKFDANDWSGQLTAIKIKDDGSIDPSDPTTQAWDAAALLPQPDERVIATYLNDRSLRKGVPFRWPANLKSLKSTDISQDLIDGLNTVPEAPNKSDKNGSKRLDYLRGDASNEGTSATNYRLRLKTKLGDIANSSPAYVPTVPNSTILDSGYAAFRNSFLTVNGVAPTRSRPEMVYVGANDGMLHGFEAATSGGGKERLAYVPSKTFKNLSQLTNKGYVHQYYVDGSPTVGDAFVNNAWKTVLVSSLGGGGRGLYALDVTTVPTRAATDTGQAETALSSQVLWEFNVEDDVPDPAVGKPLGLGYVLGQPLIRKMNNGRWAAIVSAGYNNTETGAVGDGHGYIYIIFLDGPSGSSNTKWVHGTDYIRLDTKVGDATTPNGVAQPYAADLNFDGQTDYIYAGDLYGNLWKFDVTSKTTSDWLADTQRVALFNTGGQPITSPPEAVFHPLATGLILTFGTGKYLEDSDRVPKAIVKPGDTPFPPQSFYGIWDKNDGKTVSVQTVVPARVAGSAPTKLFEQVIGEVTDADNNTFRYTTPKSGTAPDWKTQLGWFMDFPDSAQTGERDVSPPLIASRRLIFTTMIPKTGSCDKGGASFLMVVNPSTGGGFSSAVIDVNKDGVLNNADAIKPGIYAAGIKLADLVSTPALFSGGGLSTRSEGTLVDSDSRGRVSGGTVWAVKNALWCNSSATCGNIRLGVGPDSGRATWREVIAK
jgi:type IV pilus assembly protein PilY1